jgi:pimeloyl-ACP methyl ester carboxylesterase
MSTTQTAAVPLLLPGESIRPFQVIVPQSDLDDLKRRLAATRFSDKETVNDQSQGVQLATIQKLATYWANDYDWRKVEATLNKYPHFITEIDGLDIHFMHIRSKHPNALPIIITHGWPGSIMHLLKVIDPLTDPTTYGGKAEDAFDVVIPSLPGFGFSGKPKTTGWDPLRIARVWTVLMKRLGYTQYVAQGGDWGAIITDQMAIQGEPELIGMHTNMPCVVPPEIDQALWSGGPMPTNLSEDEKHAYEQLTFTYKHVYYAFYMSDRPQTLAAFADSPVGLATFMMDLEARGLELYTSVFDGEPAPLSRDDVLDNATLFWLTNTGVSAARLYWENKLNYFSLKGITIPVAVSAYPDELYLAPKSWTEKAYPNLIYYNKVEKGGHFPAWEQPTLFIEELRKAFKSLR